MNQCVEIILVILALTVAYVVWYRSRPKNLPPGPRGLPFFGNRSLFSHKFPHLAALKLKEKYGDIVCLTNHTSGKPLIILYDMDIARQVYQHDAASGRSINTVVRIDAPVEEVLESAPEEGVGLLFAQGELWKTHRRFALSTLRDMGMGKNWLEADILTQVLDFCRMLKETNGAPFNPKEQCTNMISNVICTLIFGQHFSLTDPNFSRLTNCLTQHLAGAGKLEAINRALPVLLKFNNPLLKSLTRLRSNFRDCLTFLKEQVKQHSETMTRQEEAPDYLYAYRAEMENEAKTTGTNVFSEQQLLASLFDLFLAGTDTTAVTCLWVMVYMVENPEVMRRVQEELDANFPRDQVITNADRGKLHYTEAAVMEVQRMASVGPFTIPHRATSDMTVNGYTIPQGSVIVASIYSAHRDARFWNNPTAFDPHHFLDENKGLTRPPAFAPFSVGKRACIGEALAKMEVFLFAANLLRCFTLSLPPGKTLTRNDYTSSATISPLPYELIFTPRLGSGL